MKKAILGSMVIISAMALSACSFSGKPMKIVTDEYDFDEEISNIEIAISFEDLHIMPSEDDECHIVFTHPTSPKANVEVKGDKLLIEEKGNVGLDILNTDIDETKLDIYIPADDLENIDINIASGDITLTDIVAEKIDINTAAGDITFDNCDAETIKIDSAAGDISGTLLSGKDFDIDSAAGKINVPEDDNEGGTCSINTAAGDVDLEIA